MIDLLRLLVFCWLTAIALLAVRQIALGQRRALFIVLVGFWAFNGLPLLWDVLIGVPKYERFANFARSASDPTVALVHLAVVAAIPVLITLTALPWRAYFSQRERGLTQSATDPGLPTMGLHVLLVMPLILVLLSPDPLLYLNYGFVAGEELFVSDSVRQFHNYVNAACILAVIAATALLTGRAELLRQWLMTAPWIFIACYAMGKRTAIALYLVLLAQRLWDLGMLKGARMPLYLFLFFVVFLASSVGYQYFVRNISASTVSNEAYYENIRLDYGRDHTMRAAIYAELKGEKILSYRGQSVLFDLTTPVPRAWWPQKPYPYAVYMTSYALGRPPQDVGWGFTTSIFDESIANYGWLGIFTAPLFLGFLCRIADGNRTILLRALGYIVCSLFMVVQLSPFYVLFVVWLLGSLWHQQRKRFTFTVSALRQKES